MDAVAAVRVSLEQAKKTLEEAPGGGLVGANGDAVRVKALDDGLLVYTGLSLREVEPEAIAATLHARLGAVLDAHDDARGVMVFPERLRASGKTYAEVVDELGDLGEWIAITPEGDTEDDDEGEGAALPGDLGALMSQMMGDPSQMQGLWQQAQRMMADPAMQQQLMAAAAQMMGGAAPPGAPKGAPGGAGGIPGLGGLDLGALAAQAQQLVQEDPDLVRRLQEQLGAGDDDEDDEG